MDTAGGAPLPPEGLEAAFFDLDKTIIATAALAAFRGPLHDGGLLTTRSVVRALVAQLVYLHLGASELRLTRFREALLSLTTGWPRDDVAAIVDETLERIVDPIIYSEAVDLIEQHRAAGRVVVIVSTSPEEIVIPLARHLGVEHTIASTTEVDAEGRYTGAIGFYAYGPYKAAAIRELATKTGIDLDRSYAYSDSSSDLPMLEAVGNPVAVNPDRVLARVARDRGWETIRFTKPVPLRERMRGRASRPAVVISAGAITLGVGALALGWWLGSRRARPTEVLRA